MSTHCDLRPANVKLTAHGKVKVLDFDLAKLNDPHASNVSNDPNGLTQSPTMLSPATMTQPGMILVSDAVAAVEARSARVQPHQYPDAKALAVILDLFPGRIRAVFNGHLRSGRGSVHRAS